ncbi:MAG: hypothetical protein ABIB61_00105 [Candidatus Shapirobacteria bacterium]
MERKNIGEGLLRKILKEFKKLKAWSIFVSVSQEDKKILGFYKKNNFNLCKGYWLYYEGK